MHRNFPPKIAAMALDFVVGLMVAIVGRLISFSIKAKYIASIVSEYEPLEHALEDYFSRKVRQPPPFESATLITVQTTAFSGLLYFPLMFFLNAGVLLNASVKFASVESIPQIN